MNKCDKCDKTFTVKDNLHRHQHAVCGENSTINRKRKNDTQNEESNKRKKKIFNYCKLCDFDIP